MLSKTIAKNVHQGHKNVTRGGRFNSMFELCRKTIQVNIWFNNAYTKINSNYYSIQNKICWFNTKENSIQYSMSLFQMVNWMNWPLANDHPYGPTSCKWSSGWTDLLQIIIWVDRPLARDQNSSKRLLLLLGLVWFLSLFPMMLEVMS